MAHQEKEEACGDREHQLNPLTTHGRLRTCHPLYRGRRKGYTINSQRWQWHHQLPPCNVQHDWCNTPYKTFRYKISMLILPSRPIYRTEAKLRHIRTRVSSKFRLRVAVTTWSRTAPSTWTKGPPSRTLESMEARRHWKRYSYREASLLPNNQQMSLAGMSLLHM